VVDNTSRFGDQQERRPVEAIVSEPLVIANRLYLPEGNRLKGTVLQVKPARRFGRNGQLRIAFHEVVLPRGIQQVSRRGTRWPLGWLIGAILSNSHRANRQSIL